MKKTEKKSTPCQYYYLDLSCATLPDTRVALPLRRLWWRLKRYVWNTSILGVFGFGSRKLRSSKTLRFAFKNSRQHSLLIKGGILHLKEGDRVRVRALKDVFATLDEQDKLSGLRFTPEMAKFCGRTFKVYKKLDKIIIEATGELRKIRTPTVLLEGVFCDGKAHGGCDRSCFCFWREAWLEKINPS
jgi:hypothetical protein